MKNANDKAAAKAINTLLDHVYRGYAGIESMDDAEINKMFGLRNQWMMWVRKHEEAERIEDWCYNANEELKTRRRARANS